ncbi:hypothetical protein CTAYLR_008103 [Chrysophaeum taylorii]|uniref:AP2/ERF domain-containing protein n=1 Tax=Chrysophaeum taylorii TaxID=2483200 RepID=A0AAD7UBU7_9STRA|nr:hypothetical protein CTAYLR_008103 [Chrysophaeum taylorii]
MKRTEVPKSSVRGVYAFRGKRGGFKWQCLVPSEGGEVFAGTFETEAEAIRAAAPEKRKRRARAEVPQSRFKGVYFVLGGRWEAKITYRSKSKHLGTYDSEEEAARAFDARARLLGVPERCNYDEAGNEIVESKERGVRRSRNKWRAVISVDGQSVNLGVFDSKEQAAETCRVAEAQNAQRKQRAARWFVRNDPSAADYLFASSDDLSLEPASYPPPWHFHQA